MQLLNFIFALMNEKFIERPREDDGSPFQMLRWYWLRLGRYWILASINGSHNPSMLYVFITFAPPLQKNIFLDHYYTFSVCVTLLGKV